MPPVRAFTSGPSRTDFSRSSHGSRNSFAPQQMMIVAMLQRVGNAALWWNSAVGIQAIGPLQAPSGAPAAVDPVFLTGSVTLSWDNGNTITWTISYDALFADCTIVVTSNYGNASTDTNTTAAALVQTGQGSGIGQPAAVSTGTYTMDAYDTGNIAYCTAHTLSNTGSACSGSATYAAYSVTSGPYTTTWHGVVATWSLTSPCPYSTYAKYCDQLLAAATLCDDQAAPSKYYNSLFYYSPTQCYLRYPGQFAPWANGDMNRQVANCMSLHYKRPPSGTTPLYGYFTWTNDNGINDAREASVFMEAFVTGTPWISSIFERNPTTPTVTYQYNWQNNPFFMHGCPLVNCNGWTAYPYSGTPAAPTDNVAWLGSVKSAFFTTELTSSACWSYNPGTNTWNSVTFAPGACTTSSGRFILDPVANLATADQPAGYVLDPTGGLFVVDTTSPFTPASVNTTFGYVTGIA